MHTCKIVLAFAAALAISVACTGSQDVASKNEVEILKQELADLKADKNAVQQQYIDQNAELSSILQELAFVSSKTTNLRIDVENGSAKMTQAEQISEKIETLKKRLSTLEAQKSSVSKKNKEFQKVIDGLNQVIKEQEIQISSLKREIDSQKVTIAAQKDTISSQYNTILTQNESLKANLQKMAFNLYEAGETLEGIADNTPEVSWKKNKEKVGAMKNDIYSKAFSYYQKAYEAGYEPAKDKIESLGAKMSGK